MKILNLTTQISINVDAITSVEMINSTSCKVRFLADNYIISPYSLTTTVNKIKTASTA